jgi:hypothetical protein
MASAHILFLDAEDAAGADGLQIDDLRAHVPAGAEADVVQLRTSAQPLVERFGPNARPVDWHTLGTALARLLARFRSARAQDRTPAATVVAGLGPLPLFVVAGHDLQRVSPLTFVNRRLRDGQTDVLDLALMTAPGAATPGPQVFFDDVSVPAAPSLARGLVTVGVSTEGPVDARKMEDFARQVGYECAGVVQLCGRHRLTLDAGNVRLAFEQLYDALRQVHEMFPRRDALALFVRGPSSLAFLAGRAVTNGVPGLVLVPQHKEQGGYESAFELRGARATVDFVAGSAPPARPESAPGKRPFRAKVLFLSANPLYFDPAQPESGPQRLPEEEFRAIKDAVLRARYRDSLRVEPHPGTRPEDLLSELRRIRPDVVHFGGHAFRGGIVLQENADDHHVATTQALLDVFVSFTPAPRLVVLNACESDEPAAALSQCVDAVIGVPALIDDQAACSFAAEFYGALACAESVQGAFAQACARLNLADAGVRPRLHLRAGPEAPPIFIVPPSEAH